MRPDPTESFIFVIPPVLGDAGRLLTALEKVEGYPMSASDRVVIMGDAVRGPEHRSVMGMLRAYKGLKPTMSTLLFGPSEHRFMRLNRAYLTSEGGRTAFKAYRRKDYSKCIDFDLIHSDRKWMDEKYNYAYSSDKYFISHGGVYASEKMELDKYPKELLVYGRESFKQSKEEYNKLVVYAEDDSVTKPVVRKGRVGVSQNSILVLDNLSEGPKIHEIISF